MKKTFKRIGYILMTLAVISLIILFAKNLFYSSPATVTEELIERQTQYIEDFKEGKDDLWTGFSHNMPIKTSLLNSKVFFLSSVSANRVKNNKATEEDKRFLEAIDSRNTLSNLHINKYRRTLQVGESIGTIVDFLFLFLFLGITLITFILGIKKLKNKTK